MYQQYDRRPAPVLVVLMILGIIIFTLIYGDGAGNAPAVSPAAPAVTQPAPTLAPAIPTPNVEVTAEARREEDMRVKESERVQKMLEEARINEARYAQTMTANEAVAQRQLREHQSEMARIEMERNLTYGAVFLAVGLALVIVIMAAAYTVRMALEAQRKAHEAAADHAKQERMLVDARRRMVETRTRPAYRPAVQPTGKMDGKQEPMPMNGKTHQTGWEKKPEPEEQRTGKLPLPR